MADEETAPVEAPAESLNEIAAPKSWFESGATFDKEHVLSTAPEGVDKDKIGKILDKSKTMWDVLGSYSNLETLQGKSVKLPSEDSTPEDIAAFNEKRGVPTDGVYGDNIEGFNTDAVPGMDEFAKEAGFTKAQRDQAQEYTKTLLETQSQQLDKFTQDNLDSAFGHFSQNGWGREGTAQFENEQHIAEKTMSHFGIDLKALAQSPALAGVMDLANKFGNAAGPAKIPGIRQTATTQSSEGAEYKELISGYAKGTLTQDQHARFTVLNQKINR